MLFKFFFCFPDFGVTLLAKGMLFELPNKNINLTLDIVEKSVWRSGFSPKKTENHLF